MPTNKELDVIKGNLTSRAWGTFRYEHGKLVKQYLKDTDELVCKIIEGLINEIMKETE